MSIIILILASWAAPEDSNCHYLLDKQLAHYFPAWECSFDSSYNGMRTSQGCLDLLNWYIDLETRYHVMLSRKIGLRYRNHFRGDYNDHLNNHYFDPLWRLSENFDLMLSITTHYYKGENEIGAGYHWGKDYLNYLETFISAENFDRNFSLKDTPDSPTKFTYAGLAYPFKLLTTVTKTWTPGRLYFDCDLGTKYRRRSTTMTEEGWSRKSNLRVWHGWGRCQLGLTSNLRLSEYARYQEDSIAGRSTIYHLNSFEIISEPMIAYQINARWKPVVYLTYDHKDAKEDSQAVHLPYIRSVFAYLVDLEFSPGGRFVWHFGTQRQFWSSRSRIWTDGQGLTHADRDFRERRINVGLEYRYNNIWFYLVEAMEGDFPTEKYLHNHTYLQLQMRF